MSPKVEVLASALGGTTLAAAALRGELPEWYGVQPHDAASWRDAAESVRGDFSGRDWLGAIAPALDADDAGRSALERCAREDGLVVTTGQQPGLFGGPLYVIHKALTALALARAVERATGRCTVPLFWAATDDTDFAEARKVGAVVGDTDYEMLLQDESDKPGLAMSAVPLGTLESQLQVLRAACGDASTTPLAQLVERIYGRPANTLGGAYVELLRRVLGPLGIAVLDASHSAVRTAGTPVTRLALEKAPAVAAALHDRSAELRQRKFKPQVADIEALSLVFRTGPDGIRERIAVKSADAALALQPTDLGPNVLLRPVMERFIVPTIAYVGGPGEVAYFAQVSAVAAALGMAQPRVVPRWSGFIIEPRVREALDAIGASVNDLRDPHAMETRIARMSIAPGVRAALDSLRKSIETSVADMSRDPATDASLARSVGSMAAVMSHRISRIERRYAAMLKREGTERLHEAAIARANLFPAGTAQERVLGFVPFLARGGDDLVDSLMDAAARHAASLVQSG